jgi:hypothetical protein
MSAVVFLFIYSGEEPPGCGQNEFTAAQKMTVASLDAMIDLGLKLSTALVGFGAAALLGIKVSLDLPPMMRLSIALGTMLFVQSAFYAFWWRYGLAQVHLDQCFELLLTPKLQYRFNAHFFFFAMGLIAIGVVVVRAAFKKESKEMDT